MDKENFSVEQVNNFSNRWIQELDYSENFVFSGTGYYLLGQLLTVGAGGTAKDELEIALELEQENSVEYSRWLRKQIATSAGVSEAVGMWLQPDLDIYKEFIQLVTPATIETIPEQYVLDDWVKAKTNNVIDKFPISPSSSTLMLLATVLIAEAQWLKPFILVEKKWNDELEACARGTKSTPNLDQAAIISHEDTSISRLVCETDKGFDVHIVSGDLETEPQEVLRVAIAACNGSAKVRIGSELKRGDKAGNLSVEKSNNASAEETLLHISIPLFEIESQHNLLENSRLFGLETASDPNNGHFPKISSQPLAVSAAAQSVAASFDIEGFKAATVTAAAIMRGSAKKSAITAKEIRFNIENPFGFLVVDRKTQLVLFTGWINEPNVYI